MTTTEAPQSVFVMGDPADATRRTALFYSRRPGVDLNSTPRMRGAPCSKAQRAISDVRAQRPRRPRMKKVRTPSDCRCAAWRKAADVRYPSRYTRSRPATIIPERSCNARMLLSKTADSFWVEWAMLLTLPIPGSREKGKVGTGTFFTTIVNFEDPCLDAACLLGLRIRTPAW
jgi:hypothetical protein